MLSVIDAQTMLASSSAGEKTVMQEGFNCFPVFFDIKEGKNEVIIFLYIRCIL